LSDRLGFFNRYVDRRLRRGRCLVAANQFGRNALRHARHAVGEDRLALARQWLLGVHEIFEVLASRQRQAKRNHAGNSHLPIEAAHDVPQALVFLKL
jgi:Spy/CpxP family protein refolding chaperone